MILSFSFFPFVWILFINICLVYCQQTPSISYISKEQFVNIGDTVDLQCSVHYSSNYPVLWVKINEDNQVTSILSSRSKQHITDQRYSVRHDDASSTYTLQITKIQQKDNGLYQCQVIMSATSKVTRDAWIHVRIPPVILDNSTTSVATTTGSKVTLGCWATGYPTPRISWRRENNDILPTGGVVYRGNVLTIHDISKHDRGTYYCIANNDVGTSAKRHVGVDVEFPPVVTLPRVRYRQAMGYDMDLHCLVEAYPQPSIIWLKDQYQLFDNQRDHFITTYESTSGFTESKLRIANMDSKSFGLYNCKAINKLGHDQKSMILEESYKVECPPACGISGAKILQIALELTFVSFLFTMRNYYLT